MRTHVEPRFRKRLPCQVKIGGSAHEGWIVNLSRSGLFVQTGVGVRPGEEIEVALQAPTASPDLVLRSRVVWRRSVPAPFRDVMGGIGVQIHSPPESYYSLVDAVERLYSQVPRAIRARRVREGDPEPRIPRTRFLIRIQQIGGIRTRTLEVDAESEAEARRAALDLGGDDWTITRVQRLATD
jgi:Tfp pilus assembly protein PilZ